MEISYNCHSMDPRYEVFCAGNAVVDVLARPVDGLAAPGASQRLEEVALGPGGNGVNTAMALARLGIRVALAAPVGEDRLGEMLRQSVRAEGVDDSNVISFKEARTSASMVLVDSSGERRLLHFRGANAHFSARHLNWDLVKGTRVFHYASAFALPSFDGAPLAETMGHARQLGCLTSMNPCWDLSGRWLPLIEPALAYVDYFYPNQEEGRQLTGETEPRAIAGRLHQSGVKTVIVKQGSAGCYVDGPEGAFSCPGFEVRAIDTTGAGDCFAAAFLAAICRGNSLAEAARFANAAGALATLGMGGGDSAPRREQVLEFLTDRAGKSGAGPGREPRPCIGRRRGP
jgi:sugar/nucleoside kinase (ribokinase family)